jgi:hypothetical protein
MAGTLGIGLLTGSLILYEIPSALARGDADQPAEFHVVMPGAVVRMQVQRAISGAARRLAAANCQSIFSEFRDEAGQPLQSTLDAMHQTGAEYLAALRFIEGGGHSRCRSSSSVAAFIEPRSHVVYICGARFQSQFTQSAEVTEILLIHELLHALGLGENPPASSEITHRVMARCGG